MTHKEAKELSLQVWRFLTEHPELTGKHQLPGRLFDKISGLYGYCPLCQILDCGECPLGDKYGYCCGCDKHPYQRWDNSRLDDVDGRKEAATEIVRLIEAWNVED